MPSSVKLSVWSPAVSSTRLITANGQRQSWPVQRKTANSASAEIIKLLLIRRWITSLSCDAEEEEEESKKCKLLHLLSCLHEVLAFPLKVLGSPSWRRYPTTPAQTSATSPSCSKASVGDWRCSPKTHKSGRK